MIIKSDFKDYYDCIQKCGVNPELVYKRYERDIEDFDARMYLPLGGHIIGFCGKFYPVLAEGFYVRKGTQWFYDLDSYMEHVEGDKRNSKRMIRSIRSRAVMFFDQRRQNTPVFVINETYKRAHGRYTQTISLNERLNQYDFAKVVDPYSAYQEIYMWLSNIAAEPKEIPHVSDADLLEAKGFDPRYSFRQSSPGKKRKRRKNK